MTGFFYMHFGDDVPKNIEASRQLLLKMLSPFVLILPLSPLTRSNLNGSDFIMSV